jgi:hypothetical protein
MKQEILWDVENAMMLTENIAIILRKMEKPRVMKV